jgi:hypothetical protein
MTIEPLSAICLLHDLSELKRRASQTLQDAQIDILFNRLAFLVASHTDDAESAFDEFQKAGRTARKASTPTH